jgi:hypothetical protein
MEKRFWVEQQFTAALSAPPDLVIPTKGRNLLFRRQPPSARNEKRNRAATEWQITNYQLQITNPEESAVPDAEPRLSC